MNLLARLSPGDELTRLVLSSFLQVTCVILAAAVVARVVLGRIAAARHGLWLGTLLWVLLSPVIAIVADRAGFVLWSVNLPVPAAEESKPPRPILSAAAPTEGLELEREGTVSMARTPEAGFVPDRPIATEQPSRSMRSPATLTPSPTRPIGENGSKAVVEHERRPRWLDALTGGLTLIWVAGVLVGFARFITGLRRMTRLFRAVRPFDSVRYRDVLGQVHRALGTAELPEIELSGGVTGPVAVGILRPRVVLPDWLPDALTEYELRDVLVHECAHVIRHDVYAGFLQRLAAVFFWPHPLVHYLNGQLSRAREEICDNHVIRGGDACGYARTLLRLTMICRPHGVARAGIGLLTARWTLADRVAGLLEPGRMPMTRMTVRTRIAVAAVLAVAGLIVAGVRLDRTARAQGPERARTEKPRLQASATTDDPPNRTADGGRRIAGAVGDEPGRPVVKRTFTLTIVDRGTGSPIQDAAVKLEVDRKSSDLTTDPLGRLTFPFPDALPKYLSLSAKAGGYVPIQIYWRSDGAAIRVPDEFTLRMEKGTSIGGLIKDDEGRPVTGATVYLLAPSQHRSGESRVNLWDYPVKTDEEGRWRCDLLPAELDDVWIRLAHPDYISDNTYGATPKPTIAQLRDRSGVMVMKKGQAVRGRVVDADTGRPIADADVAQGSDRFGSHYPGTKTDAEGRFEFRNVKPGELVLTVRAKGHAPDLKPLTVAAGAEPVEFRLGPGRTVRGRVVDPKGQPVAGAFVAADTWRGHRSLEWRVDTDAEGRFRWDEAPADAVLIDMGKTGFLSIRNRSMTPSDDEYRITMSTLQRVRGTVVDAATGKPVETFTLVPGINWQGARPPSWQRSLARAATGGRYETSFSEPYPFHLVRIEAPGYLPAESRAFTPEDGDQVFDFKLEKGRDVVGLVRMPDGTPLVGADVLLLPAGQGLVLQDSRAPDRRSYVVERTDAEGRFRFPPQERTFTLITLHDRGYAQLDSAHLGEDGVVAARPWGRVEGTLRVAGKPAPGEQVALHAVIGGEPRDGLISSSARVKADGNSRFAFERVPPGPASVSRVEKLSDRLTRYVESLPVDVEPGGTAHVEFGETGRPVVGRVIAPEGTAGDIDFSLGFSSIRPSLTPPTPPAELGREEKAEWLRRWSQTDQGRVLARNQALSYAVKVAPDGSFRAEGVPAGTYQLSIQVQAPAPGTKPVIVELLGSATSKFTVPEIPGGRSEEPLQVGSIELKLATRLRIGEVAPAIAVRTVDDSPLKLDDFRGKYVLLDFWATWCGPCREETPHLKDVYDAFGKDDRFAMVGLSLDAKPDEPRAYAKEKGLGWTQGFLGDWSSSDVPERYGVRGIPSIWLLGPDGKVVAKDLRGDKIKAAVAEALDRK